MWGNDTISARRRRKAVVIYFLTVLIAIYLLWPLLWMTSCSFQKERALQSRPPHLVPTPDVFTLDHYCFLLTGKAPPGASIMLQAMYTASGTEVLPGIRLSLLISLTVTFLNLLLGVPAAHAFARIRFPGSEPLFLGAFATRLLPSISLALPMFIIANQLGLVDNPVLLVIIYTAITLPFTLWLLRSYFARIPMELEEAARIDGASWWRILRQVVVPLAKPGLVAAAVFAFMLAYSEFIFALVLTQTVRSKTMPVIVASLATGFSASRGMIAASAVLSFFPPLLVAIVFRKYIIEGLSQRYD